MAIGPGKYDDEATRVRLSTKAKGVIVVVLGGHLGTGFSAQASLEVTLMLPRLLRDLADQIEESEKNL
jgi:hypothetical protein